MSKEEKKADKMVSATINVMIGDESNLGFRSLDWWELGLNYAYVVMAERCVN